MRKLVDRKALEDFMVALGKQATSPSVVYFTGGATALLRRHDAGK
jgi:hypothetical protein